MASNPVRAPDDRAHGLATSDARSSIRAASLDEGTERRSKPPARPATALATVLPLLGVSLLHEPALIWMALGGFT